MGRYRASRGSADRVNTSSSVFFLITVFPDFADMPVAEFQERKKQEFCIFSFFAEIATISGV
jgi:hypothetical protein